MTGFTDIHSHFVYGVDDGAKTRADMEAMLDAAYADGVTSLFATSHMTPGISPFDFLTYRRHLDEAQSYCQWKGYAMALYPGAEIMYTPALQHYVVDHRLLTLANSDYVLMEFVPDISFRELEAALDLMERYAYIPVLAHIERYACLFRGNVVARLKSRHDVRCQVNANTVLKEQGFFRARRIQSWFQEGLVDFVASDAHDVKRRPFQMQKVYATLKQKYGQSEADRLTGMYRTG